MRQPPRLSRTYFDGCYRFIHNLEAVIKNNKRYSWNLGKIFTKYLHGAHFKLKSRSNACHLHFQNLLQNRLYRRNFYEIKVSGGVYILKIARIFLFKGAFKTRFTFSKNFSNQTEVVNQGTESIRRALCYMQMLK